VDSDLFSFLFGSEEERKKEERNEMSEDSVDVREVIRAVRRRLRDVDCDLTGGDAYGEWTHVFRLEYKPCSGWYIPVEVCFDQRGRIMSLCFELSLGLGEAGEEETPEKVADWLESYADYMKAREQQILSLGFYLDGSDVDGVHHIRFYYRRDYRFDEVEKLVRCVKKIVDEVWTPVVAL